MPAAADAALVRDADLILTMEPRQVATLLERFPGIAGKAVTLGEYAGNPQAIADPIGCGLLAYAQCAEQLATLIRAVAARLVAEAGEQEA